MGAPKQRWAPEEEAALKAGVAKHGLGKWRTILRDSDFSKLLRLRSNIDLKDKWRNLSGTPGGYGSKGKARMALKKGRRVVAHDAVIEAEPLAVALEPLAIEESPDKSVARSGSGSNQLDPLATEYPFMSLGQTTPPPSTSTPTEQNNGKRKTKAQVKKKKKMVPVPPDSPAMATRSKTPLN